MKRIISAVCAVAMMLMVTACGDGTPPATNNSTDYKIGTASYTHTNDTYGYTEGKNGQSAVSTTYVAAVFDNGGKIVKVMIDEVETRTAFDSAGQLAGYTGNEVVSKKELGDNYGMKAASGIGKEWYQQVETLEKWLEGKDIRAISSGAGGTVSAMTSPSPSPEGKGIMRNDNSSVSGSRPGTAMAEGNIVDDITEGIDNAADSITGNTTYTAPSWMDEDLRAGVTIDTTYMIKAIEKAYRNAK